jgi:hypothetical protein
MRKKSSGFFCEFVCVLATVVTVGPCMAQTPPSAAPGAQGKPAGCLVAEADASSTASIVQATGESLQRKRWQPRGGTIQFTVRSFPALPDKSSFLICFRWKTTTPEDNGNYVQVRPDRLDRNNDGTTWTVTTTIPVDFPELAPGRKHDKALPLVPLADVRILAFKENRTLAASVATTIGITYPWWAIVFALATIVLALGALWIITVYRLTDPNIRQASWPLRVISTPSGYASLSQLQIVLWTLVVAASAVYVMSLSGDLIQITDGTLVLLGIAGVAAIGAKVHGASQTSAAPPVVPAPAVRPPQWSDLIFTESPRANGTVSREIDVARFQMLLFTLITAVFVLMNVVTTYVIPEIPTGFQTLMGISNAVYLGAKVAQG